MAFQIFSEKEIRSAILRKINPIISKSRAGHAKGKIFVDGKFFGNVKIPNPHKNEFRQNKAKNLASQIGLTDEQYNDFVSCKLKSAEYYKIILDQDVD